MEPQAAEHDEGASGSKPAQRFGLRARHHDAPLAPGSTRFHIFLIDTGWNGPVSKVLREHMPLFHHYHPQDPVYILSRQQSIQVLKTAPEHIGSDPMVVVYDLHASKRGRDTGRSNYRGFRLNLGLIRNPEQALAKLQEFLKFIATHRAAECLSCEVQRELHREGLGNVVKLLREASEASLELL